MKGDAVQPHISSDVGEEGGAWSSGVRERLLIAEIHDNGSSS
jgi:hypothetical protein